MPSAVQATQPRTASLMSRITEFLRQLGPRGWTVAILGGALATRLAVWVTYDERPPGKDSREYLALADQLAAGNGFPRDGFRTPGYPAFLAALEQLPGRTTDAVIGVQHILGVLLVVAILHVTWHFFGKWPAILAATLAAFTPGLATLENWLLADFLFGCLVFAGVSTVAFALDRGGSSRLYVAAGLLFALAAYVKPAGQFLVLAAPLGIFLATRDVRSTAKGAALVTVAFALAVAPWVIRTHAHTGQWAMSTQAGVTLFNRAFEFDRLPVPTSEQGGPLLRRIQLDIAAHDGVCVSSCLAPNTTVDRFSGDSLKELTGRGMTKLEALRIQRRLAVAAIRDEPFTYAGNTAKRTAYVFTDANRFLQYDLKRKGKSYSQRVRDLSVPAPARIGGLAWLGLLQAISWFWLVAGLLGMPLLILSKGRARTGAAIFAAAWLTLALLTAASHGGLWRYSISLAPLTWILGAAGAAALVVTLRRRFTPRTDHDHQQVLSPSPELHQAHR